MENTDSLQGRFNRAAEKYSDNIALRKENRTLTYGQLLHCAEKVRDEILQKCSQKSGATVAILTDNDSFLRFIYMFGVLKSGFTYLPVDGSTITERTFRILQDGRADLLLTEEKYAEVVDQAVRRKILTDSAVCFFDVDHLLEAKPFSGSEDRKTGGDRVAYVIYTSGSTGIPKGVEVQDRAVLNFSDGVSSILDITQKDVTLALSSFSFDASLFDMYPFLFNGGEIIMTPREVKNSISSLNQFMIRNRVTIQCMTTALYHLFLSEENETLEKLCVIGEKMMHYREKSFRIYNMYGPTEAACLVTLNEITESTDDLPAGYPIPEVEILILDDSCRITEPGTVGEIAIAGASLAKGYRNNPEKTEKSFITLKDGRTVYLTGDIGMLDDDGNLHCHGRKDNQVKYRGYRIELDEIRNVIIKNPLVKEAYVLLYENNENKILVGACSTNGSLDERELKKYLQLQLPEYMIPDKLLFYSQLPLNNNGKIDKETIVSDFSRRRITNHERSEEFSKAKTILSIWSETLLINEEDIPFDVSFKELGGNSLQMLMMIVSVNEKLGVHLPIEQLIECPTINRTLELIG